MWECKEYTIQIRIKLDNGFYFFDNESAIGKTYLAKLIEKYSGYGEPILAYSYKEFMQGIDLDKLLENEYKVIVIDRYDMFEGYCLKALYDKSKNSIVLVDLKYITEKSSLVSLNAGWCTVVKEEDFIEVVS